MLKLIFPIKKETQMSDEVEFSSNEEVKQIINNEGNVSHLSLETLALLVNTDRLKQLKNQISKELGELRKRQGQVTFLHNLIKKINHDTTATGEFDFSKDEELKKLFVQAKEMGVEVNEEKFKYNKEERDRLVDNIRMTIEDYNISNDMQLQTINRLTNERYESYQLARSILKPLHESKSQIARGIK